MRYKYYVPGIVLNQDNILLSEVVILPWMSKNQFKDAMLNELPNEQTMNATRKLNVAHYTALAYAPVWTPPDMIIERQLNINSESLAYKGMVAPNQSFNFMNFAVYFIYLAHQNITKEEREDMLRNQLRKYLNQDIPE